MTTDRTPEVTPEPPDGAVAPPAALPVPRRRADPDAPLGERLARGVVDDAIRRYVAARHARIGPFVDRHFSFTGSLALHRHAMGWDLVRAPANVLLAIPYTGARLASLASQRLGAHRAASWLDSRNLLLSSAVGREVQWLVHTELLELPYREAGAEDGVETAEARMFRRDALAEEILADPRVDAAIRDALAAIGQRADDPAFQARLAENLTLYVGTRTAAAEIATSLSSIAVGAVAFKSLTPGVLTLGPKVAAVLAQHSAIAGFPLGSGLGGMWYGAFPATAGAASMVAATGGLVALASVFVAFSGVLTDPVQRKLGLHQRRLGKLVDHLGKELGGAGESAFAVRDHYVARLLDLLDVLAAARRLAGG